MNTVQILNKVNSDLVLKQVFLGVFPIDLIPKIQKYPSALIVNLDASNLPGSHWVALYFNKNNECEYFDSYGRKPELFILKYISKNSKKFVYNNKCVQDLWTISCGQMCLYYLTWRCTGISFKQIIKSMMSDNFIKGFVDYL